MDYDRPMGRAIGGNRIGCPHLPAWPTEGSQFCLKNGLIFVKLAQNFTFWKSTASYHKAHLKIELGTPNYIQIATKNVFLALKIPKLQSEAKKRQWRHLGAFGALNSARWRSKLEETSRGYTSNDYKSLKKIVFWDWKNGLYPVPSVRHLKNAKNCSIS